MTILCLPLPGKNASRRSIQKKTVVYVVAPSRTDGRNICKKVAFAPSGVHLTIDHVTTTRHQDVMARMSQWCCPFSKSKWIEKIDRKPALNSYPKSDLPERTDWKAMFERMVLHCVAPSILKHHCGSFGIRLYPRLDHRL